MICLESKEHRCPHNLAENCFLSKDREDIMITSSFYCKNNKKIKTHCVKMPTSDRGKTRSEAKLMKKGLLKIG